MRAGFPNEKNFPEKFPDSWNFGPKSNNFANAIVGVAYILKIWKNIDNQAKGWEIIPWKFFENRKSGFP